MNTGRYQRHSLIDWFSQDKLSSMKVCIIGAGAVGNEVLKNLVLLGVGTLDVYDFDKIEIHNLTRSVLFRECDIGQAKSEVACARARDLDPNISVKAHFGDFWDLVSVSKLQSFDLVFCCVDNFEARIKLNKICYLASVDLINIGIDSRYASVDIFPFQQAPTTACYECTLPPSVYEREAKRYSCGWLKKVSYVERKVPTTIITASTAASMAVSWGLRLGTSEQTETSTSDKSKRIFIDTISGNTGIVEHSHKELCPCCGLFNPATSIVKASPLIDDRFFSDLEVDTPATTIWASDPILTGYTLVDDKGPGTFNIVFDRASRFDNQFAGTVSEDANSVLIEIRDQFELTELQTRFHGRKAPIKFFVMQCQESTLLIDLEEKIDV